MDTKICAIMAVIVAIIIAIIYSFVKKINNKRGVTTSPFTALIITVVVIIGITLPFHYVPEELRMFPKDNFTFSHTFITQSDIDEVLERYNNCKTIFEQQ